MEARWRRARGRGTLNVERVERECEEKGQIGESEVEGGWKMPTLCVGGHEGQREEGTLGRARRREGQPCALTDKRDRGRRQEGLREATRGTEGGHGVSR